MTRQNISSGSAFEARISYSRAVVVDDWVMVSGTTGYDYDKGTIAAGVVEQAEQTFINIDKALQQAGSSIKDVVRINYILVDKTEFPQVWPVLKKWLGDVRPAATMIQAELMDENMRIEIEVTAKKGASDN